MKFAEPDHFLAFSVPNLEAQTARDVERVQRGYGSFLKFGHGEFGFGQAIKWNARIEMVDVMVADVSGEPRHDRTHFHVAGGFKRGLLVGPPGFFVERDARKIVLRVEQIRANRAGDEMRDGLAKDQTGPAEIMQVSKADEDVQNKRRQTIEVASAIVHEWVCTHAIDEHENVAEQNRERVADEKISKTFAGGRIEELGFGHDRKRSDMRAFELRIVIVMMVVAAAPDAAGAESIDAKCLHEPFGGA